LKFDCTLAIVSPVFVTAPCAVIFVSSAACRNGVVGPSTLDEIACSLTCCKSSFEIW
jgi:hypothetical protein